MAEYCEICGEELSPEEEDEGICENCKIAKQSKQEQYKEDEDYLDPGIT